MTDTARSELTREKLANAVIVASANRDPEHPRLCAVAYVPERGPRELLADELKDREAAARWLDFQKRTVGADQDYAFRAE